MTPSMDQWLQGFRFDFFSKGGHKVSARTFLERKVLGEALLLDVRSRKEAELLAFPGALHIPLDELPRRKEEVPREGLVAVFCSVGTRSAIAYAYLSASGWENVRFLATGYHDLVEELKPGRIAAREGLVGGTGA